MSGKDPQMDEMDELSELLEDLDREITLMEISRDITRLFAEIDRGPQESSESTEADGMPQRGQPESRTILSHPGASQAPLDRLDAWLQAAGVEPSEDIEMLAAAIAEGLLLFEPESPQERPAESTGPDGPSEVPALLLAQVASELGVTSEEVLHALSEVDM